MVKVWKSQCEKERIFYQSYFCVKSLLVKMGKSGEICVKIFVLINFYVKSFLAKSVVDIIVWNCDNFSAIGFFREITFSKKGSKSVSIFLLFIFHVKSLLVPKECVNHGIHTYNPPFKFSCKTENT